MHKLRVLGIHVYLYFFLKKKKKKKSKSDYSLCALPLYRSLYYIKPYPQLSSPTSRIYLYVFNTLTSTQQCVCVQCARPLFRPWRVPVCVYIHNKIRNNITLTQSSCNGNSLRFVHKCTSRRKKNIHIIIILYAQQSFAKTHTLQHGRAYAHDTNKCTILSRGRMLHSL